MVNNGSSLIRVPGARILRLPSEVLPCATQHIVRCVLPLVCRDEVQSQGCYNNCIHNEYDGLVNRHLADVTSPKRGIATRSFGHVRRMFHRFRASLEPWSEAMLLSHRAGRVVKKFERAFESLRKEPLNERDYRVSAFVKLEKATLNKLQVKHPRLIQYRNPRYTAELAKHLGPVEHKIIKSRHPLRTVFAKGLNQRQRAQRILEMQRRISNCVFIGLDHNNFDAHEHLDWIKEEHLFYEWLQVDPTELRRLLQTQKRYVGRTRNGIKYTVKGRRCSGDLNTGLGNSLVNLAIILDIFNQAGIPTADYEIFLDGDDCVLAVREGWVKLLLKRYFTPENFAAYGMSTRIEFVTKDIHEVVFCQSGFVDFGVDVRMIRNPWRVLSRATTCLSKFQGAGYRKWLRSVGECELACNAGVPVLQSFSNMLIRLSGVKQGLKVPDVTARMRGAVHGSRALPINSEARTSFECTFGISVVEQISLEHLFDSESSTSYIDAVEAGSWVNYDMLDEGRTPRLS